jgi:hypothetical protein
VPNATGITQSDAKPRVPRVAARENVGLYTKGSESGSPRGEHQGDTAWPQAERLTHTPMTRACIGVAVAPQLVLRTTRVLRVRQVRGVRGQRGFHRAQGDVLAQPHHDAPPGHSVNRDTREHHPREHHRSDLFHGVIACDGTSRLRA